ncbi:MAG: DUF1080 domain-containing protein [Gemmataceae bacterium]|nr:DUF1080 domain-containing protein [Gemmataceae bacterium]
MRLLSAFVLVAAAGPVLADDTAAPKPPPGFTALFNGKDLSGWQGHIDMNERKLPEERRKALAGQRNKRMAEQWSVEDGVIRCKGGRDGVSLQTAKDYKNFELMVDWKIDEKGDSGIYLRGQPQVQIWDSDHLGDNLRADAGLGSGGLWNNPPGTTGKQPTKKADKPVGEWNTFHITVVGDKVTVKLNGETVVDGGDLVNYWEKGKPVPAAGPIELQFHGDPLWFRNVYIKELP